MESMSSVEKLSLLEKKVFGLVEVLATVKVVNAELKQENNELLLKIEKLENAILKGSQNLEELSQESVLTKMVVDELINNIDKLVQQDPRG